MRSSTSGASDARLIVEWVLGVRVEPTGNGGHDFGIVDAGDVVGALRVVDARPPLRLSSYPLVCGAPKLSRSWVLHFSPDADLLADLGRVHQQLERLESAGVAHFGPGGAVPSPGSGGEAGPGTVSDALDLLAHVGVVRGAGAALSRRPSVLALAPAGVGTGSAHVVNEVVEDEAWRPATRTWADAVDGRTRHLFVWVDDADLDARVAMEPDVAPEPPLLPLGLTDAWVARRPEGPGPVAADRLWQTGESGAWETLGPVRRRLTAVPSLSA